MHRDKSYYKLIEVLGRSEKKITYLSEVGLSSFLPDEDFLAITESGNSADAFYLIFYCSVTIK